MGDAHPCVNPLAKRAPTAQSKKAPPGGGALLAGSASAYIFFSSFFISFLAFAFFLWCLTFFGAT